MKNQCRCIVLVIAMAVTTAVAVGAKPTHFESVPQMLEALKLFGRNENTLQVLSEDPVEVVVIESFYPNATQSAIQETLKRNLVEVVFRSFASTGVDTISVVSAPAFVKPPDVAIRSVAIERSLKITVTRERALIAFRKYRPEGNFVDILTSLKIGEEVFEDYLADDFSIDFLFGGRPGITNFYAALTKASIH